jgi:acyl transferase domain-containing protein
MGTMATRKVFLFPGLGAYSAGMMRQARRQHPVVDRVFAEMDGGAAEAGLPSVSEALFGGEARSMAEMQAEWPAPVLHLAMFGASIAIHRILVEDGVRPYLLVGHSFGEIAALVAGGAFDLADGVRLVCARARALEPWEGRGAMAAVGASTAVVEHIIGALDDPELVVACVNAPGQTVISGPIESIDRAEAVARALDLFFTPLYLPYASHHPAMRPAVAEFVALTETLRQRPFVHPVHSPIHGRRYRDEDDLRQRLGECLVLPVRFADTIRGLHEQGASVFIEVGAMRALTRCVELTVPGVQTFAPLFSADDEVECLRRAAGEAPARPAPPPPRRRPLLATDGIVAPPVERRPAPAARPAPRPAVRPAPRPPIPAAEDRPPRPRHDNGAPSRPEVLERLRALYAQALEYPPEVLTEEALLEGELGVDSLKQTALLGRVVELFRLPPAVGPLRGLDFPSLGHVADHVLARAAAAR